MYSFHTSNRFILLRYCQDSCNSNQSMLRKEINKMRTRKVETGSLVGEPRQIPTCRRRPGVPQAFDAQPSHFTLWTIPNFFPNTRIYLLHLWLRPLSGPTTFTPISLRPLSSPPSHIRLRSETAPLRCSTVILCISVFDAMTVENVYPSFGLAAVERVCSLI